MDNPALRTGSLLEETWSLVRAHPVSLLLPFVVLGLIGGSGRRGPTYRYAPGTPPLELLPFYAFLGLVGLVVVVLLFLAYVAATLMTTRAAFVATQQNRDLDFGEQHRETRSLFVPTIGTTLLWLLAVVVGFILLIVPGFIVLTALLPWTAVVVAESRSGVDALRRAWDLTRGHRWSLFLTILVMGILSIVASALVGWIPLVGGALSGAVSGAFLAASVALSVLAYEHLRREPTHAAAVVNPSGP